MFLKKKLHLKNMKQQQFSSIPLKKIKINTLKKKKATYSIAKSSSSHMIFFLKIIIVHTNLPKMFLDKVKKKKKL